MTQLNLWRLSQARSVSIVRHAFCVLALMWTGVVNGQPFFFSDTSNYIRAADITVHLLSGKQISSVWTDRYRKSLVKTSSSSDQANVVQDSGTSSNNLSAGLVMGGRSPYIGAFMYAGWVLGWFWPFVLFQSVVSYVLIILVLKRFGADNAPWITGTVAFIAFTTSLPTYNSMLLADAFASFGIISFALIALPGFLTTRELIFLVSVLCLSVISHLTHLMMFLAMLAFLVLVSLARIVKPPRRLWVISIGTLITALLAIQATSVATIWAVGRAPQLLPLLTARFYSDGPGRLFISSGCDGNRFEVCRLKIIAPVNDAGWLFDSDPKRGVYMLASPDQQRKLGEEDVEFAIAVLKAYPKQQIIASINNTIRQLFWVKYDGLNQGCFDAPNCWVNLPSPVRDTLRTTPSGRNLWPVGLMSNIQYISLAISLALTMFTLRWLRRNAHSRFVSFVCFIGVIAVAMFTCSFFGGAVADPQYRYQGRLIWLLALIGAVSASMLYQSRRLMGRSGTATY